MNTPVWIREALAHADTLAGKLPSWVQGVRRQGLERFLAEGLPTTRLENWRHTSLAALEQQQFTAGGHDGLAQAVQALRGDDDGCWLVFANGRYEPELSQVVALPEGVVVSSLSAALTTHADLVQEMYGNAEGGSSLAALNAALATDGAFIHLSRGVAMELPVHLVFVSSGQGAVNAPRNLIHAEAGAVATVVEHYIGNEGQASFTNAVTLGRLHPNANITHLKLQREDNTAFHVGMLDVQQHKGSVLASHSMSFGARLARHDILTDFRDPHCETLLNGLYYVDGRRHVDHHTSIGHSHPHGVSREYYRGILDDQARGVFAGRIVVAPGADKTDAVQRSDSLLLSKLARADARPELEIYADDVKCAHGATVGQMDADSLFYLRSRGLDADQARKVLTYAFAAEAIERIASAALRSRVIQAIGALAPEGVEAHA